jgi:uncharacterized protein (DUF1697 family)
LTAYIALLRAVNVGGRKLRMSELKAIAEELGLAKARTFIASGNLLFTSSASEERLRRMLERRLAEHMHADVPVMLRTAEEMAEVAAANPFSDMPRNKVVSIFLKKAPPPDALKHVKDIHGERIAFGAREIYVAYPHGMGQSKLQIPAAALGTARNMNSVAKLAELAKELE